MGLKISVFFFRSFNTIGSHHQHVAVIGPVPYTIKTFEL